MVLVTFQPYRQKRGNAPIDFPSFTGTVQYDGDALTGVSFEIEMSKLQSDNPRLTKHLLNEDFFDVEKFPKSTFTSTEIRAGAAPEHAEVHILSWET